MHAILKRRVFFLHKQQIIVNISGENMTLFKLICCFLLLTQGGIMESINICDSFKEASSIIITKDGEEFTFQRGDDKFELVIKELCKVTENSNEMPAFGVSIDKLTREKKQTGLFIELEFPCEHWHNEMNFETLLIEVNKDFSGVNIIRKVNGKYEGRCFYLNLANTMESLYSAIEKMSLN